jgi:hypothetical protein
MTIDAAVDRAQCLGSDHLPVHHNIDLRIIHGINIYEQFRFSEVLTRGLARVASVLVSCSIRSSALPV